MEHHLVVIKPFLKFIRGDIISDATQIGEVMAGEYKRFVTKILVSNTSKG